MIIVLMGVTGVGKTTIGQLLAARLSIPFFDADDYHSLDSKEKMNQGVALSDEDRKPWLKNLYHLLEKHDEKKGIVLACSALKETYRTILQGTLKTKILWVHLEGTQELILERLKKRTNHFMNADLLGSQFETLEKPLNANNISIEKSPEVIVEEIVKLLDQWN